MRRTPIAALFLAAMLMLISLGASALSSDQVNSGSKDRLVISFTQHSALDNIEKLAYSEGSTVEFSLSAGLAFLRNWDSWMINAIENIPGVTGVEREKHSAISFVPNDPYYSLEQWGPKAISSQKAWDYTLGIHNVTVAVLDTGIDYTHEDIAGNMWTDGSGHYGYDFWNNDNNPMDDNINGYEGGVWMPNINIFHGTHVAGIVGAVINNGIGVSGMADCRLMAVKVMNDSGEGTDATVAQGMIWAVDHGADIITMSLGVDTQTIAMTNSVAYAREHGVLMVAAAGNDGLPSISYPAGYPQVIAVGATDQLNHRASFSNYGSNLEIMAPGVQIFSTKAGDMYQDLTGTSTATPFIAGVAALMLSVNPALTPVEIREILNTTASDLGSTVGWDSLTGWGLVNAGNAVAAVSGPAATLTNYPANAPANTTVTVSWVVSGGGSLPITETYLKWGYSASNLNHISGHSTGNVTPHSYSVNITMPTASNGSLYAQAVAIVNGTQHESTVVSIPVQSGSSDPFSNLVDSIRNFIVNDIGLLNFVLIIVGIIIIVFIIVIVRHRGRAARAQSIESVPAPVAPAPTGYAPPLPYQYYPPPAPVETPIAYVDISNNVVAPVNIEVYEGSRVIWRNRDWAPPPGISIVSGFFDETGPHPDGIFASGRMASPGEYWSAIFNVAGEYPYYVSNMNINGRVIVRSRPQ